MVTRRSPDSPQRSASLSATGRARRAGGARKSLAVPALVSFTPEARRAMIAEHAYLRAERRGFAPGHETEDWLAAESEVDTLLKLSHGGLSQ